MNNKAPVYVREFAQQFLNTKNFIDINWGDIGLKKIQVILKKWINNNTRNINQHTFKNVEVGSNFTKDELISLATYMWSVSQVTVQRSPSDQYPIEKCWISNAGALQPSGRHRISFQGAYYFNYVYNATIMYGPANYEWSHLCNNPRCERPSHLCDEDHNTNLQRINCPGIMYCHTTDRIWILCTHNPKCKHVHLAVNGPMTIEEYKNQ